MKLLDHNSMVGAPLVIIESPYAPANGFTHEQHLRYARACLLDCLNRGEAPFASHLLYTQVLDDGDPDDREAGILAGFAWHAVADYVAVYTDLGLSRGMKQGIKNGQEEGVNIVYRSFIPPDNRRPASAEETWETLLRFLPGGGHPRLSTEYPMVD